MGNAIAAGMTLSDYHKAELWEVLTIIDFYLLKESEQFKLGWEQARFIMSAMTDMKKHKFPWEKTILNMTPEELEAKREGFKKWRAKYNS